MTGGWSLAHFQDVVHLQLIPSYSALKLGSLKVIAAQVGSSHWGNFTSSVLVKDILPRSFIASRLRNKSNSNNSPSPIKTSTVIGNVVPTLSSTTPTPQLLSVSMHVSFCFHFQQHCLQASDCVQPMSTRAIHDIPSIQTVLTGSTPFMYALRRPCPLPGQSLAMCPC